MRRLLILGALLVALAVLAGCAAPPANSPRGAAENTSTPSNEAQTPRLDPAGNLVLYVSNQSFDLDPVDISITIDGQTLVHQSFEVGNQHNWSEFVVRLAPGSHVLEARSVDGRASLSQRFEVTDKLWAVVDYWYSDGSSGSPGDPMFTFRNDDKPIGFD